jgi:TetR/AcrR family transcriptional regulator, transcriptional repressor for nem operon
MSRGKEFDRTAALQTAIVTFAARGFEGTSTDDLLQAMGIGRQSMYDTFGDKRRLYLSALREYCSASLASVVHLLERSGSPLAGIEAVLLDFARNPLRLGASSCLGVNSICEFGRSDPELNAVHDEFGNLLEKAFERQVRAAVAAGEVDAALMPRELARYLSLTLCGMKVGAEAGSSPSQLVSVARLALRALAPARQPEREARRRGRAGSQV